MIPKIIHYCWFGNSEKPMLLDKCIFSWKKYMPEYEVIEWNEHNIDIESENTYVKEAYNAKKYAFVSDYIRLKKLVEYGGVYFDTDYEVIKFMDDLLKEGSLITGFESRGSILTAMIASERNNYILAEFLDTYKDKKFVLSDGQLDTTPINVYFSKILNKYGVNLDANEYQNVNNEIIIYPIEVLCGFDVDNWHERKTFQTYGVHHMENSWASPKMQKHIRRIQFIQKLVGLENYDRIKTIIKKNSKNVY